MRFIRVKYFKKGSSLCADDFKEDEKNIVLNVDSISEASEIQSYTGWGNGRCPKYFWIRMNNGMVYNCIETEYKKFISKLIILNEA